VLTGGVTLTAEATASNVVSTVEFLVDGEVVALATGGVYVARWSSASVPNGAHLLAARATDLAGLSAESEAVPVTVVNPSTPGAGVSVHTSLGVPDAAATDPTHPRHFLSVRRQYALSYDSVRKTSNWVAWQLNASWLGPAVRQNEYRPDPSLPANVPQAQLSDYAGSGFDRGHLCNSEDRTLDALDNSNTFFLTNMIPQAHNNNAGPWEGLEFYARSLARSGKELFVLAGGLYAPPGRTIGAGAVAVPSSTWKVVVVLDSVGQGASDVTGQTRVISINIPNDDTLVSLSADWKSYRVSARSLEAATGLDFNADVPQAVQDVIEQRVDGAP
jgi:endonuclease G